MNKLQCSAFGLMPCSYKLSQNSYPLLILTFTMADGSYFFTYTFAFFPVLYFQLSMEYFHYIGPILCQIDHLL